MITKTLGVLLAVTLLAGLQACAQEPPPEPPDPLTDVEPEEVPEQDPPAPPGPEAPELPEEPIEEPDAENGLVDLGDGLSYEILTEGEGAEVIEPGSQAVIDTVLTLPDGTHVWSGDFRLVAGSGQAIEGYDRGIRGMRLGEERRIHVPWQLGYGARGNPPTIPGEQDLVFTVILTSLQNP